MAGRSRFPYSETDSELPSPSAKKTRLSGDSPHQRRRVASIEAGNNEDNGYDEIDCFINATPIKQQQQLHEQKTTPGSAKKSEPSLESSEVLPLSDESFGDEDDPGKITIGRPRSSEEAVASAGHQSSSSGFQAHQQLQLPQLRLAGMGREDGNNSEEGGDLTGDNAFYEDLLRIGDGAYGTVYRAMDRATGQIVALKRIRVPLSDNGLPPYTLREISTLKNVNKHNNPYIVRLLDVCQGGYLQVLSRDGKSERLKDAVTLWLVFEHVDQDLASFMSAYRTRDITPGLLKQMAREILLGVDFLHGERVIHRDLKPQNLLVTREGHIKIADFGLAKTYDFEMRLTTVVVTLWYRAPEVLLRSSYATSIDIWSIGCILAELSELKPLFPGTSEGDQLDRIFSVIGTPPREEWPENVPLSWSALPFRHSKPMETVIPNMCPEGRDLVKSMLIFNPLKRVTAKDALKHPYFARDPR